MSLTGMFDCVLDPFKLVDFLGASPLLVVLDTHISQFFNLVESKPQVVTTEIELPADERTGFLYQDVVRPDLSGRDVLMQFEVESCQF